MTSSEERSYYEIALTNRQVAFAIGTLLICVVGAFIAGLWVAREAMGERGPDGPTLAQAEGEEPFAFFGDADPSVSDAGEEPASGGAEDAAPQGDEDDEMPVQRLRTPADDGDESTESGADDAAEAERRANEQAVEEPEPEVVVARRAPEPEEEEATAVDAPETATPQERRPPAAGSRVIQVFSSADREQAQALLGRLEQAGYSAFMDPLDNGSRTMFRVRVGPYSTEDAAKSAASRLRRDFRLETWITSR